MSVLNLHLVTNKELFLSGTLEMMLNKIDLHAKVRHICCIKNWQWEEEQELNSSKQIPTLLLQKKIVVVYFDVIELENFGMYIEKKGSKYVYSFWWNMNETTLCSTNEKNIFEDVNWIHMFHKIKRTLEGYCTDFVSVAFGEETMYDYSECIEKTVEESHNVILWLLKREKNINNLKRLEEVAEIPSLEAILFKVIR